MATLIILMMFLFSYARACDQCVLSKASVISKASTLLSGACGYGSFALKFNGGHVTAAVPSLYKDGAGCGACFQIRCKNSAICSKAGTKVIMTDVNKSNNGTDLVLSNRAFRAMALPGKDQQVLNLGVADVEYKRSVFELHPKQDIWTFRKLLSMKFGKILDMGIRGMYPD